MARLEHSPGITGVFSHNGDSWTVEDGFFTVEDEGLALELVESYTKIRRVEDDSNPKGSTAEDTTPDYPTNDEGEPLCVGKEDGQCGRTVDTLGGSCWQH